MADEPTLPRLPGVLWDEQSQTFSNNPRKRVRTRSRGASQLLHNSSDPAVFSSDDDPGLDNYVEGRHKKRYVGSWFQQQPASSDPICSEGSVQPKRQGKRTLARQVDSGVFLGSDDTESDVMENMEVSLRPKLSQLEQQPPHQISKAELAARDKIRTCIEQGNETIDLWSMDLEEISDETVSPLSQLSCIPVVVKDVAFEQKDPELKVFLAVNRLTRIPGALFDLTHITTLSLRGNKLTELPSGISKLCNLRDLNVAQNRLRYLPAELLELIHETSWKRIILDPNPFLQPDRELDADTWTRAASDDELSTPLGQLSPRWALTEQHISRRLGRSPLQSSSSSGTMLSDFKLPSGVESEPVPVEVPAAEESASKTAPKPSVRKGAFEPSRVPSLLEIALRSCYESDELPELEYYLPGDVPHLRHMLNRAAQQKEDGGLQCSRCKRHLVVPPLEWVEWRQLKILSKAGRNASSTPDTWTISPHTREEGTMAVPFRYRGCSWLCRPDDGCNQGQWKGAAWNLLPQDVRDRLQHV